MYFSIHSVLQNKTSSTNIDDVVSNVAVTLPEARFVTLDKVWSSLQGYLEEAMISKDENKYYILHGDKEKVSAQTYQWSHTIEYTAAAYNYAF